MPCDNYSYYSLN